MQPFYNCIRLEDKLFQTNLIFEGFTKIQKIWGFERFTKIWKIWGFERFTKIWWCEGLEDLKNLKTKKGKACLLSPSSFYDHNF